MRLVDISALRVEKLARKWGRRALALLVIVVCALVALAEGMAALRLALEAAVGPIWARVVLAVFFLAVIAATALILRQQERQETAAADRHAGEGVPAGKDERVSMIAEAIDFGYSLARDFKQQPAKPATTEPAAPENDPPERQNGARAHRRSATG